LIFGAAIAEEINIANMVTRTEKRCIYEAIGGDAQEYVLICK
jgi:hypothetical protein